MPDDLLIVLERGLTEHLDTVMSSFRKLSFFGDKVSITLVNKMLGKPFQVTLIQQQQFFC